jgi:hypothetical protein
MNVIKRNGQSEPVMFDKITARIGKLCVPAGTRCSRRSHR